MSAAFYAVCFDEHALEGLPPILNLAGGCRAWKTAHPPAPKKGRQGHPLYRRTEPLRQVVHVFGLRDPVERVDLVYFEIE
jgi:hypothetical protein